MLRARTGALETPSVVGFASRTDGRGEIVVGRQALDNAERDPANTIYAVTRLLGRAYGESTTE